MKKLGLIIIAILAVVCISCAFVGCSAKKYAIGTQNGTTGYYYVKGDADWGFDGFSNVDCKGYDNAGLAVTDMLAGQVDYVIIDEAPAKNLVSSFSGKVKVIDFALTEEQYAFGIDKAQDDLKATVNSVLAKITSDGTFDAIVNKYFNNGKIEGITSATKDANKNQLIVATNAAFAPFEYKIGDKYAGIDMEIVSLIAEELGVELVIENMEFDSVVTSVGKNGVDMAAAGLTVNETRKESVNFSDSYYQASQMVLCKANDTTFDKATTAAEVEAIIAALKK